MMRQKKLVNNNYISVIIPTKNSETYLEECFKSIKNQSYKNVEIIVVDNNSTDKTKEIARKYTNNVYNKGPERSPQRNFGSEKAKGKYLVFLDSDMILTENVLLEAQSKFEKEKKIGGLVIPEKSIGDGFWARCKALEKELYEGVEWIEAARIFQKDAFVEAGGYDESLISGEDWDLTERIGKKFQIGRISEYVLHNEGKISLLKTVLKKYYYARKINTYLSKKGMRQNRKQANIYERYKLFLTKPNILFKNPMVGLGMLFMKACEFIFGGIGIIAERMGA
ncbi:MAG: glycosyltransferase family 2 protein [Candidatus Thorarchaeota archaeon]